MQTALEVYEATTISGEGVLTASGLESVLELEGFATEVAVLDAMEQDGKVSIDKRCTESWTGKRYVDRVHFTRIN